MRNLVDLGLLVGGVAPAWCTEDRVREVAFQETAPETPMQQAAPVCKARSSAQRLQLKSR